jgi:hypothetical protein
MCSSGGNQNMTEGSIPQTDSSKSSTKLQRHSSTPYVFHRTNFNDKLGVFGADPNLFSPPQNQQKVASPEQTKKDLDFLKELDEKERNSMDHAEAKVPIFARTISVTQRTAIPSERLNFASVQECNFNNLYKRHLCEIGFSMEPQQNIDTASEFEPFTPITRITPDREASQEFNK